MALQAKFNEMKFGVGDRVRVVQTFKEGDKQRTQAFEGMVIAIKGRGDNQSFTVRRKGVQQVGIERIFPIKSPQIKDIEIVRKGVKGVRRAKLYYIRGKSKRKIEEIYSRAEKRERAQAKKKTASSKKKSKKRKTSKASKK